MYYNQGQLNMALFTRDRKPVLVTAALLKSKEPNVKEYVKIADEETLSRTGLLTVANDIFSVGTHVDGTYRETWKLFVNHPDIKSRTQTLTLPVYFREVQEQFIELDDKFDVQNVIDLWRELHEQARKVKKETNDNIREQIKFLQTKVEEVAYA